jgi:ankyrin repeat protein
MSTTPNRRSLDASVNLESLKKEAKRWLKALRDGDSQARERLQKSGARASSDPTLREVQHALALEFGVSGWTALKEALADAQRERLSDAEWADDFLRRALDRQDGDFAAQILRKRPNIARFSIHTAVVAGDLAEVERRLKLDPKAASSIGGPNRWQPLQYLCYARTPDPRSSDNDLAIAHALLDAGADAKAMFKDDWDNPFTLITGAIGEGEQQHFPHAHAKELVQLLIARGAEPFDTQSLYNTSLHADDTTWLDILYEGSKSAGTAHLWLKPKYGPHPDNGMLDYLLGNAVSRNHVKRAAWLLERGARATTVHSYTKRKLHTEALLHGFIELASLLERHGATGEKLNDAQAFQAACMRCDEKAAKELLAKNSYYLLDPTPLRLAADFDLVDVATFLLDLGMSPNVGNGWTALHSAAYNGSLRVAKLLIERGATVDVREPKYNSTPLGAAVYIRKQAMIDYLSTVSRDVFAFVRLGNLERLRTVLDQAPERIHETLDGKSLFFFLSGPEERAIEIAELLLARGANPKVKDKNGQTAGDIAAKHGFDDLAELLNG